MRVGRAVAVGALVAAMSGVASPAVAQPAEARPASAQTDKEERTAAALKRIENKTYTQADLALIRSQPEIARHVPDPTDVDTVPTVARQWSYTPRSTKEARIEGASGTRCYGVDLYWTKRGFTRITTAYRWHHVVNWCATNGRTSINSRYDYLSSADPVIETRGRTVDQRGRNGRYHQNWSHIQRRLQYCVLKYGCYANTYPGSKITVDSAGYYSYWGSAG